MKKQILLIDDDKDEWGIFTDALAEMHADSFNCIYADNMQQALQLLTKLQPEYIFVDYNMPMMNGLEFLYAIKEKPGAKTALVFLYSTTINPKSVERARVLGAAGCLKKPDSIHQLALALRPILMNNHAA